MRQDALDWLMLCLVPGVSGAGQRALLKAFGSPAGVGAADRSSLTAVAGSGAAEALIAGPAADLLATTLAWLELPGHHLLALGDEAYPRALLQIPDPPTIIYTKGNVDLLNRPAMAIVGSRNATRQGLLDAREFAVAISRAGYAIASGLALGIDAAAHRGGLDGGSSTIAIVGTGLDRVYPSGNRDLAVEIARDGVLISEFPLTSPPLATHFPRRNRVISGLSRGVLVVEAAMRSGSITTARMALEQGRDVFAIPGSIHSPVAKGCHWLIKQGAKLVESAEDVLTELEGLPLQPPQNLPLELPSNDDRDQGALIAALGYSPSSLDALVDSIGIPAATVAARLTRLELEGRVERLPGGYYRRLAVP